MSAEHGIIAEIEGLLGSHGPGSSHLVWRQCALPARRLPHLSHPRCTCTCPTGAASTSSTSTPAIGTNGTLYPLPTLAPLKAPLVVELRSDTEQRLRACRAGLRAGDQVRGRNPMRCQVEGSTSITLGIENRTAARRRGSHACEP